MESLLFLAFIDRLDNFQAPNFYPNYALGLLAAFYRTSFFWHLDLCGSVSSSHPAAHHSLLGQGSGAIFSWTTLLSRGGKVLQLSLGRASSLFQP